MTTREWVDLAAGERAFQDFRAGSGGGAQYVLSARGGEAPTELETRVRYAGDGVRYRRECEGTGTTATVVFDGERMWTWSPEAGAVVYDQGAATGEENELLRPVALGVAFELEPLGDGEVAGRATRRVRARPRSHEWRMHSLGLGADEIELDVDAERGIVLRAEARYGGTPFRLVEVLELELDAELPSGTFVFEPPAGETVRPAGEAYAYDRLPVEEIAARAGFVVWMPAGLAPPWRLHAIHRPASERPRLAETVHLLFFDDALHSFSIEEAAERLLAWRTDEPRVVGRGGVELRVLDGRPLEVHGERGGTHFRLSSDTLDADALVELAASLVAAPTEPPALFY